MLRKLLCLMLALLLSCSPAYADLIIRHGAGGTVEGRVEAVDPLFKKDSYYDQNGLRVVKPPNFGLEDGINVSNYTTDRVAPWWINYHLTLPEQVASRYHGGDAAQCTYALTYCPTNPDIMFLGTDTAGIYKSTDGGKTFLLSSEGLDIVGTNCIAFDPDDENIVYVTTSPIQNSVKSLTSPFIGLYKSVNCGKSWQLVTDKIKQKRRYNGQHNIAFGEKNKSGVRDVFICGLNGLFMSFDGGVNFNQILEEEVHNVLVTGGAIFAATPESGILVSRDNGETWDGSNSGIDASDFGADSSVLNVSKKLSGVLDIAVNPVNPDNLVCATAAQMYFSENGGQTWASGLPVLEMPNINTLAWYARLEYGAPDDEGNCMLYAVLNTSVYPVKYSSDGGKTFGSVQRYKNEHIFNNQAFTGWFAAGFAVHPTEPRVFNWAGYATDDGGYSYSRAASGFSGARAQKYWFNPDKASDMIFACIDIGAIRTYDFGDENEEYPAFFRESMENDTGINRDIGAGGSAYAVDVDPRDRDRVVIVLGRDNTVLKESVDGGFNYRTVVSNAGYFLKIHAANNDIIYTQKLTSYDNGVTWNKNAIDIWAVYPKNNDVVYGFDGRYFYISTDRAKTFKQMSSYNFAPRGVQKCVVADAEKQGVLYIPTYVHGLAVMDERGNVELKGPECGLSKSKGGVLSIIRFAQNPLNPDHLACGGCDTATSCVNNGVYESFDRGKTWKIIPEMPGPKDIYALEFHPTLKKLFVGTSAGTFVYEYDKYFDRSDYYFSDIGNSIAVDEIQTLHDKGIIDGYSDGTFNPQGEVSRTEFVKLVSAFFKPKDGNAVCYSDIPLNHWASKHINTACANGLLTRNENGMFNPDSGITHQETAVIAARILDAKNIKRKITAEEINSYTDAAVESRYSLALCGKLNIIRENDSFEFTPEGKLTREQAALIISRLLNIVN